MESLRVCQLSTVHKALDVRITKQAETLAGAGHQVFFVVPDDGSAKKELLLRGIVLRALNLPTGRLKRMFLTGFRAFFEVLKIKADAVVFHDSELLFVGLLLKLFGKRVVYDIHENVAEDILTKEYLHPFVRRPVSFFVGMLQKFAIFCFDGISTATPAIAEDFTASRKIVLQNFPKKSEMEPGSLEFSKREYISYAGGITRRRSAVEMVKALGKVAENIKFKLAGRFESEELKTEIEKEDSWSRVEYLDWISRSELKDLLSESLCGLVLFHPGPNHDRAQPNKIFEYMSAGIPLVASNFEAWKPLIEGESIGICVDPQNPEAIGEAIEKLNQNRGLAESMGRRARALYEEKYTWEAEEKKLIDIFEQFAILKNRKSKSLLDSNESLGPR